MGSNRIVWVDQLRGFAILLVIIGHLIQFNGLVGGEENNPVFEIIYSFHMPLFFAISGYLAEKTTRILNLSDYLTFAKKKIIALGLPWIAWGLVVNKLAFSDTWPHYDISDIVGYFGGGLWFLRDLLIVMLLFGLHKWAFDKYKNNKAASFVIPYLITIVTLLVPIMAGWLQANFML